MPCEKVLEKMPFQRLIKYNTLMFTCRLWTCALTIFWVLLWICCSFLMGIFDTISWNFLPKLHECQFEKKSSTYQWHPGDHLQLENMRANNILTSMTETGFPWLAVYLKNILIQQSSQSGIYFQPLCSPMRLFRSLSIFANMPPWQNSSKDPKKLEGNFSKAISLSFIE